MKHLKSMRSAMYVAIAFLFFLLAIFACGTARRKAEALDSDFTSDYEVYYFCDSNPAYQNDAGEIGATFIDKKSYITAGEFKYLVETNYFDASALCDRTLILEFKTMIPEFETVKALIDTLREVNCYVILSSPFAAESVWLDLDFPDEGYFIERWICEWDEMHEFIATGVRNMCDRVGGPVSEATIFLDDRLFFDEFPDGTVDYAILLNQSPLLRHFISYLYYCPSINDEDFIPTDDDMYYALINAEEPVELEKGIYNGDSDDSYENAYTQIIREVYEGYLNTIENNDNRLYLWADVDLYYDFLHMKDTFEENFNWSDIMISYSRINVAKYPSEFQDRFVFSFTYWAMHNDMYYMIVAVQNQYEHDYKDICSYIFEREPITYGADGIIGLSDGDLDDMY